MPQSGIRLPQIGDLEIEMRLWMENIPGANEHVAGWKIHTHTPTKLIGKVALAADDPQGKLAEALVHTAEEAILVVHGGEIYPPVRHALMRLAEKRPIGADFGLAYEKGFSAGGTAHISRPNQHFSRITAQTIGLLQGAVERDAGQYRTEDQVTGWLGLMYEALARPSDARFVFSEYAFSRHEDGGLVMQGKDGRAVLEIVRTLNTACHKTPGWHDVTSTPVSFYTPSSGLIISEREPAAIPGQHPSPNDPSNQFVIDPGFFAKKEHMEKLSGLAKKITQDKSQNTDRRMS